MSDITIDLFEYSTDALAQAAYADPDKIIDTYFKPLSGGGTGIAKTNQRMVIAAANIVTSGSQVRIKLLGYTSNCTITGASIGERSGSTGGFSSAPTRLTFGGSNGGTIPASGCLYSDWLDFTLDEAKDYLVHLAFVTDASNALVYTNGMGSRYYRDYATDDTLTQSLTSYSNDGYNTSLIGIQVDKPQITPYSENTIKEEGSYALKCVATTNALNSQINRNFAGTETFSFNLTTNISNGGKFNRRQVIPAANISASGTAIRLKLKGHISAPLTISACSVGERSGSTASFTATPTRVTFNSGDTLVVIPSSSYIYSDWIPFTLDEAKDYLVAFAMITDATQYEAAVTSGGSEYYHITSNDETLQTDGSSYSGDSYKQTISAIEVSTGLPDLTGKTSATFRIRSSRTGSNIKVGIKDIGGTVSEVTPNIASVDTWQTGTIDLSGVSNANKDAISQIIVTCVNADAANTFYLDWLVGVESTPVEVSATCDSIILSTYDAAVNNIISVNGTTDALVVATTAAVVKFDTQLQAGIDTLVIDSKNANINAALNIATTCDTLIVATYQANVFFGAYVEATVVNLVLAELSATVNAAYNIKAGIDELILTAYNAMIGVGVPVNATLVALTLTEYTANIKADINVSANLDTLVVSGKNANIKADITFTADCDALVITEKSANVNAEISFTADFKYLLLHEWNASISCLPSGGVTTGDWRDYKGDAHDWIDGFVEQGNKWGYLNNPNWTDTPSNSVNYDNNFASLPMVWKMTGRKF